MDNLLPNLVVGITSGLVVVLFTLLGRKLWRTVFMPWHEERLYQDVRFEGTWMATETLASGGARNDYAMALNRRGHRVSGTLTSVSAGVQGITYLLDGTFRDLVLTLTRVPAAKNRLDRGTWVLKLKDNGTRFAGCGAYYAAPHGEVRSCEVCATAGAWTAATPPPVSAPGPASTKSVVLRKPDSVAAIDLNFINNSKNVLTPRVVIFQKNMALGRKDMAVAWRVIENCRTGDMHPFSFPMALRVAGCDKYGNMSPQLDALPGQLFRMHLDADQLEQFSHLGSATDPKEIQVKNDLPEGDIGANIYRDGKLLSLAGMIAPGNIATFELGTTIWIGVVAEVKEGDVIYAEVLETINTEISLTGIASADIVMTDGGPGQPFQFSLENVKMD